jgi:sulfatase modifying factor 1
MPRLNPVLLLLAVLAGGPASAAGQSRAISPHDWLARPGVRLLAVEFYADWCQPCKKAIPRWQALRDTYGPRGFRLVVVTVDSAQCVPPGLSPDQAICDEDARLSQEWEATELPQAFLWAWPGQLLVEHGTVTQVEKAVADYFGKAPRIAVEEPTDGTGRPLAATIGRELHSQVRGELSRSARFEVIADAQERAMIRRWRKASAAANYDENTRCKIGMEVAPNSVLKIALTGSGAERRLRLDLFSLESSCVTAWVQVPAADPDLALAASDAVAALVTRLVGRTQANATHLARETMVHQDFSAAPSEWVPETGGIVMVQFASKPAGATVLLDGQVACQDSATPCRKNIAAGSHRVAMHLEGHEAAARDVTFERNGILTWTLAPNVGTLTITTLPDRVPVAIDGVPVGPAPVARKALPAGVYLVETTGACHVPARQRVEVEQGKTRTVTLHPAPVVAALKLVAEDASSNAVAARVLVDGTAVGTTPGTFTVSVCARELRVVAEDGTHFIQPLSLQANQTTELAVRLGAAGGQATRVRPGMVRIEPGCMANGDGEEVCVTHPFLMGGTEVTQGQWEAAMGAQPAHFAECGAQCPVERVSLWDALAYCNSRSRLEALPECYDLSACRKAGGGKGARCSTVAFAGRDCAGYRLPSEREWVLAARADCEGTQCDHVTRMARCKDGAESRTGAVGDLAANRWGLFDMVGNVWEWVWTPQGDGPLPRAGMPEAMTDDRLGVLRGGSFTTRGSQCGLDARREEAPSYLENDVGFRVVRSVAATK